ncbi:hypothetical protein [Microbacterium marinum]|uniref:hypothetical protein n=1 Tax=Microbacterium marinum TaxID=421115 RepID=UPI0016072E09|nr:hypothetical protein [Microbacterium marinum]
MGEAVLWVVGAAAVGGGVWKGWPAAKQIIRGLYAAVVLAETLANLPATLAAIEYELKPNGGRSIKDRTEQTVQGVAELEATVAAVVLQQGEIAQRQDATAADVAHVRRQTASLKTSVGRVRRRLDEHIQAGEPAGKE